MYAPEGQPHQFTGQRGEHLVSVRVRDVYDAVLTGIALSSGADTADQADLEGVDPWSIAQNACCEIEKRVGVYPNVPRLRQ